MTWEQAERYVAYGLATVIPVLTGDACAIVDRLGPVEIMRVEFRFLRGGVEQVTRVTLTRRIS